MSRVLVVGGQFGSHRWTRGWLVARLMEGLRASGHRLHLLATACEDPSIFACDGLSLLRPFEHNMPEHPTELVWEAERHLRTGRFDRVLSLTRAVPLDVWLPLDRSMGGLLHHAMADQNPVHQGLWLLRHHPALHLGRMESRGRRRAGVARLLVFGSESASLAHGAMPELSDRIEALPHVGLAPIADDAALEGWRVRARRMLRVAPSRTVVLVSALSAVGRRLDPLLYGLRSCIESAGDDRRGWPVIACMTSAPFAVHDAAARIGCQRAMRVIGTTSDVASVIAGCDAAALPIAAEPDGFADASLGRFAADAVRLGRPIFGVRGASGMDIGVSDGVGIVANSGRAWGEVFRSLLEDPDGWRARSRSSRGGFGMDALVTRLDALLHPSGGAGVETSGEAARTGG